MKLTRRNITNENLMIRPKHLRNLSQELNNPQSQTNYFISNATNIMSKIKNEYYLNDSITNLKNSILNKFDSKVKKGKIYQYLNNNYYREFTANNSPDFEKVLNTSISPENKATEPYNALCPYINKKCNIKDKIKLIKSNYDIRPAIKPKDNIKKIYKNSDSMKFISEDEPLNQKDIYKENNFWQCNNNILSNWLNYSIFK